MDMDMYGYVLVVWDALHVELILHFVRSGLKLVVEVLLEVEVVVEGDCTYSVVSGHFLDALYDFELSVLVVMLVFVIECFFKVLHKLRFLDVLNFIQKITNAY
jgi:hypothetical protein